jgi:hypothetical protein
MAVDPGIECRMTALEIGNRRAKHGLVPGTFVFVVSACGAVHCRNAGATRNGVIPQMTLTSAKANTRS